MTVHTTSRRPGVQDRRDDEFVFGLERILDGVEALT